MPPTIQAFVSVSPPSNRVSYIACWWVISGCLRKWKAITNACLAQPPAFLGVIISVGIFTLFKDSTSLNHSETLPDEKLSANSLHLMYASSLEHSFLKANLITRQYITPASYMVWLAWLKETSSLIAEMNSFISTSLCAQTAMGLIRIKDPFDSDVAVFLAASITLSG